MQKRLSVTFCFYTSFLKCLHKEIWYYVHWNCTQLVTNTKCLLMLIHMESSGNDVYLNAQSQLKYASNALLANHFINQVSVKNPTYGFVLCFLSLPSPSLFVTHFVVVFFFSFPQSEINFIDTLGFYDCGVHVLNMATEHFSLLILLFKQLSSIFLKKKIKLF